MSHTYSDCAAFAAFMGDPDAGYAASTILPLLEDASRAAEDYCERSRFGSGFGPRIGTNHYTGEGDYSLWLDDDLLAITSLTVRPSVIGTDVSFTESTDYYAVPFDHSPKRRLDAMHTSALYFYEVQRGIALTGKYGYQDVRVTSSATLNEALDASETGIDVTSGAAFSEGQTILVDAEQMYVTAIATNTLTVVRGANGTTAATHLTAAPIDVYRYPSRVVLATNRLAQRYLRAKDAGADGTWGGADMPVQTYSVSERGILRQTLWRFRCTVAENGHLAEIGATAA